MSAHEAAWFAKHTVQAPQRLREHAAGILAGISLQETPVARLAAAGQVALANATGFGDERHAALDLLAADGLITLALLASAEASPESLGATARALRLGRAQ